MTTQNNLSNLNKNNAPAKRRGKHYRTAQMARMLLKSAMRRAIKCHLLKQSPAADLELPQKPPKRQFHKPSPEDWQALVDYPHGVRHRHPHE